MVEILEIEHGKPITKVRHLAAIPNLIKKLLKIPAVIVALIIGSFGASQAGWSGAEGVINYPLMGIFEDLITDTLFCISMSVTTATCIFVHKTAKLMLLFMVPLFLYLFLVTGVWNGVASDFDAVRLNALKYHYANAYSIEHMNPRGRFRTCRDERIALTGDAKFACTNALSVAKGERIPGSEHRCGFLNMFRCFATAE